MPGTLSNAHCNCLLLTSDAGSKRQLNYSFIVHSGARETLCKGMPYSTSNLLLSVNKCPGEQERLNWAACKVLKTQCKTYSSDSCTKRCCRSSRTKFLDKPWHILLVSFVRLLSKLIIFLVVRQNLESQQCVHQHIESSPVHFVLCPTAPEGECIGTSNTKSVQKACFRPLYWGNTVCLVPVAGVLSPALAGILRASKAVQGHRHGS